MSKRKAEPAILRNSLANLPALIASSASIPIANPFCKRQREDFNGKREKNARQILTFRQ